MNEKAVEARDRKAASKAEANAKASKAAEDAYWREAGEGSKTKAQAKRDAEEKKKQELAAKKLEAKKLLEEEEASLHSKKPAGKAGRAPPVGKVTHHQLQQQREAEQRQREAEARERDLARKREVAEEHYAATVEAENTNRQADVVSATGVDEALSALTVADAAVDKNPEKRMKAAWMAYQERMLPELRQEKPNLKMSQYKDMIWKLWQKAPENPLNQQPPQQ